jgi:hypothetical protein
MGVFRSCLVLFASAFSAGPIMAQTTPVPAIDEPLQKFLNVPVWYLNYRIELSANGSGGNDEYSWRSSIERVSNGVQVLGMRSQGPSLTMPELAVEISSDPGALEEAMALYANWLPGNTYDENKTQEENDAEFNRLWEANQKTTMSSLQYSYWATGTMGPNWAQASGSGQAMIGGNIQLEFDAKKKKYNFLFLPGIFDGPATVTAVTGVAVINEGSELERRDPIERSLTGGDSEQVTSVVPPFASGPMGANIVGNLPATFGPLSGVSIHNIKANFHGDIQGTYTITYTLSPNPPAPLELLIIPPNNYYDWRPMGGKNEKESGDRVPIKVKLQKPGGGDPQFKAQRFTFRLKGTSREKGVCMNEPQNPLPDSPFDLQFEAKHNPDLADIDSEGQEAVQTGQSMTEGEVIISSFDYGAYADLEVEALLENGEKIKGVVPGTSEEQLKVPDRKDDSRIASVFLKNLNNPPDKDDSENDPEGDGFEGDGLALYEEYRGFKHGDKWMTGDPVKKDVFVLNQLRGMNKVIRGIQVFETATKLKVHYLLQDDQVNPDMVINFNHNADTHVVDQHVIRIKAGKTVASGAGSAFVENVGTPGTARSVNVPEDLTEYRTRGGRVTEYFAATLAHEMLHSCNTFHHGEEDDLVLWELNTDPVPDEMHEYALSYNSASGQYDVVGNPTRIIVKKESGEEIAPENVFKPGETQNNIYIGLQQGLHSGDAECLMRYDIAYAYPSITERNVRYLSGGEAAGLNLCDAPAGTGVNDPSRDPQSRYGPAATSGTSASVLDDRGDCRHQLRVNDLGMEPDR